MSIKLDNDRIFKSGSYPDMRSETVTELPEPAEIQRSKHYSVAEHTVKETTIQSVLRNAADKRVIALNFANAMYAGGGYVLGGNAQEESLCRASLLYYTIKTQKKYYRRGELLGTPLSCDFITCPAVNRSFAKFMMSGKRIDRIMRTRIKRIITLALIRKPDLLVLGAFGCGMFGNKREKVLPVFEEMINSYVPDDVEVIFAIP